jgi:translation initiation factor 2-alpha kinase 4
MNDNRKLSAKAYKNDMNITYENFDFGAVSTKGKSRFKSDFEVLSILGQGGGGVVYKVKNIYDTYEYAIKKIKIEKHDQRNGGSIIKEIMYFSRLQHNNIAKYLQAWIEEENDENKETVELSEDEEEETQKFEEILSQTNIVQKIESDSMVEFERSNKKHLTMWDEVEEEKEDEGKEEEIVSESKTADNNPVKTKDDKGKNYYLYIQMEFCEGQTLREAIHNKSLDENAKWDIISALIDVINYIHDQKLIHRDIKPSNIFLDKNFNVKLGDFGLAKILNSETKFPINTSRDFLMSNAGDLLSCGVGTMYYCSPEQEKGGIYDEKTDIFSLGIVIFEMFFSFGSLMHRDIVLREIREKHNFPNDFVKNNPDNVFINLISGHSISKMPY